ncbi:MAG: sugar phosphate isomerase/epimerase family protein [Planctomycetota bacterium]|jgi:sugar phosphate isomerase/epimerase
MKEEKPLKLLIADGGRVEPVSPLVRGTGFGIEIQAFCLPDWLDDPSEVIKEIADKIADIHERALHGPFSELVPPSRDAKIRRLTRERFDRAVAIAKALACRHLVLHSGFIPKTYGAEEWLARSLEFWNDFLAGKDDELAIHVENVYEDDFSLLARLVDEIGRPDFSICFDVGHANANSQRTVVEWIGGLGTRIGYVHLHTNDGIGDDHFGLWKGNLELGEVCQRLRRTAPEAPWTLETVSADREGSLNWLREKGFI